MVLEQQELKIEDTLEVQQAVLKSLAQMGNHKECICNSIDLLRQLNFDIPLSPTKDTLINAMKESIPIVFHTSGSVLRKPWKF